MKRIIPYLFFCFTNLYTIAQTNVDSLESVYEKTKDIKIKTAVTIQLGRLKNAYGLDGAEALLNEGLNLAKKIKDSTQIAKAYETIGMLNERLGNLTLALSYADSASTIVQLKRDTFRNFSLQMFYGELNRRKAKYAEALTNFLESAKIAEQLNKDDLRGKAYNALGVYYVNMKNYNEALNAHLKALQIHEKIGSEMLTMTSLGNLGIVYRELRQFDKALEKHKKALNIVLNSKDSSEISYQYNEIGVDFRGLKKIDSAIFYIKKANEIRLKIDEKSELSYSYSNLAKCFQDLKQFDSAELYFKKAIEISKLIGNNRQLSDNYKILSDLYKEYKKYDSAFNYSELYSSMRDKLIEEDNQAIIQELTVQYHTKEQDLKIQEQELKIKQRNYLLLSLFAVTAAIVASIFSRMKRKKLQYENQLKDVALEAEQKASAGIIEAEENERQRLAAEIHDGVGQLLNVAKLKLNLYQENNNQEKELVVSANSLLNDGIQELRNISHNITPPALMQDGLITAIQKFITKFGNNSFKINLYHEGWDKSVPKNTEIILYRIIQECIQNIVKHANANNIDISLIREPNQIDLSIDDDGKGFDKSVTKSGLGLINIQKRVNYLKGEIEIDSTIGNGTNVMIHVPV